MWGIFGERSFCAPQGRFWSEKPTGFSVHRRPAAAPLVLLPGTARARIVPADLGDPRNWQRSNPAPISV